MTEEFAATPSEVVACGGQLADNARDVAGMQSALQSEGDGDGAGGCAITPGDTKSFWEQLDWVEGCLGAQADFLKNRGDQLQQAGCNFQEFDQV